MGSPSRTQRGPRGDGACSTGDAGCSVERRLARGCSTTGVGVRVSTRSRSRARATVMIMFMGMGMGMVMLMLMLMDKLMSWLWV